MRWLARTQIALTVAVIASAMTVANTPKQPPEKIGPPVDVATEPMEGYYSADGHEQTATGQKAYSGVCTIRKARDIFVVTWSINGSSFTGIGLMRGDTFSVGWGMPDGKVSGLNVYKLNSDGTLDGHWATFPGSGKAHPESLKLLRKFTKIKGDV